MKGAGFFVAILVVSLLFALTWARLAQDPAPEATPPHSITTIMKRNRAWTLEHFGYTMPSIEQFCGVLL